MADQIAIRMTGDWRGLRFALSAARLDEDMQTALTKATTLNAMILRREIRENVKSGKYAPGGRVPNAALTAFIKGSTKPLVDTGQLFQAITSTIFGYGRAEIGVARTSPTANVAAVVHDGAVIRVTGKMRRMFRALADVSSGRKDPSTLRGRAAALYARRRKGWKPLKQSTTVIRIPPRPYIREVMESAAVQRRINENWLAAGAAAVANVAPKLRTDI